MSEKQEFYPWTQEVWDKIRPESIKEEFMPTTGGAISFEVGHFLSYVRFRVERHVHYNAWMVSFRCVCLGNNGQEIQVMYEGEPSAQQIQFWEWLEGSMALHRHEQNEKAFAEATQRIESILYGKTKAEEVING